MKKLPDLSRTEAAIEAYDAFNDAFNQDNPNFEETMKGWARLEALGEAVGYAFGLDTADRNSVETCKQCIRPGFKVPGPGCELSFVRKAVAQWKAQS